MRISVGPAPLSWGEEKLVNFYREMAEAPVDDVYLGEIACAKRLWVRADVLDRIETDLLRAGKTVYHSSPALVTCEEERRAFDLLWRRAVRVEINSPAFLAIARSRPAVAGAFLNIYNSVAARMLAELGIERVVLPAEIGMESLGSIARHGRVGIEVVVHGHVPMALSRSCHTARAVMQSDRRCGGACRDYPDGMVLEAAGRALFRVDGPLTTSAASCCLVEYVPRLEQMGVTCMRVQPQQEHTGRIISIYRSVLDRPGRAAMSKALGELTELSPDGLCNGWFLGKAGWIYESPN